MSYDIIDDIHGCAHCLQHLLEALGYTVRDGVHRHPLRTVIFLGDLIDRGPRQREVIRIVRPMIESGTAQSVIGNHEFNAISYHTPDRENGDYLRPHSEKNICQHEKFLEAYMHTPDEYADVIGWFRTLPLWLDLGGLRIVHARWDACLIAKLEVSQNGSNLLGEDLLLQAHRRGQWQFEALETLLKGKEILLPDGASFRDKDGITRHDISSLEGPCVDELQGRVFRSRERQNAYPRSRDHGRPSGGLFARGAAGFPRPLLDAGPAGAAGS
jgi:Calcineurin-like phosphoesterase